MKCRATKRNPPEGNLPAWRGAAAAYSKAYRVLAHMALNGHVTRFMRQCQVSQEMRDLITALDKGDEEQIKGMLLLHHYFKHQIGRPRL